MMKLYWRLRDIPEMKTLEKGQQTEVWIATFSRRLRDPFLLLLVVPCFLIVILCNFLGGLLIPISYGSSIGGGLGAGLAIYLVFVVSFNRARPHFAEEIHRRSL
jgi:hypothetical protein